MNTYSKVLISAILVSFALVGKALGTEVKIDPAGYTGQWSVDYGPLRKGPAVVNLGAPDKVRQSHVISISGAELLFNVAPDGQVTVDSINAAAAEGGPGKLTFNTVEIFVDPVYFTGDWRVTRGATPNMRGARYITLVQGLKFYSLEVGANGGFSFDITDKSWVNVRSNLAGYGSFRYLRLKNTQRFLSDGS